MEALIAMHNTLRVENEIIMCGTVNSVKELHATVDEGIPLVDVLRALIIMIQRN